MGNYTINPATVEDRQGVKNLYFAVALIEGGLARTADEITDDYVSNFVEKSLKSGIILIARHSESGQIVGEIHAYALGPKVFAHVLGELTIAVHPEHQGQKLGKALFTELLRLVFETRKDILRVELIARESNKKAIEFYQKLGFKIEGRFVDRIQSVGDGVEADIPMAWRRATD